MFWTRRQWEAKILEQVPDREVAWASTEGATNAGAVEFEDAGGGKTLLKLTLEYQPEGVVEKVGDMLHVVSRQAEANLKRFKKFIEHQGHASGAWRGSVPGQANGAAEAPAAGAYTNRFAHPFDQTNGLVDFEGESDETADGEIHSAAERRRERRGHLPPIDGNIGQH
jgi:hypothetical protein